MVFIDRETLLIAGEQYQYYFYDKVTMSQLASMNPCYPQVTEVTNNFLLNNIRGYYQLYCSTYLSPTQFLSAVTSQWTGLFAMTRVFSDLTLTHAPAMLNLGTFQYLAVAYAGTNTFNLIYKTNFTFVSGAFTLVGGNNYPNTFLGGIDCSGSGCLVTRIEDNGASSYNFQSYYILPDYCLIRNGFQVCSSCIPGYYLNSLFANNICIPYASIPNGQGIDPLSGAVRHVQQVVSAALLTTRSAVHATTSNGYYLFSQKPLAFNLSMYPTHLVRIQQSKTSTTAKMLIVSTAPPTILHVRSVTMQ